MTSKTKIGVKMDLLEINKLYGGLIWGCAERYHVGVWDVEDIYQQVLMMVFVAMQSGKLSSDSSGTSQRRVKSFIISRSIDIVRMENRRRKREACDIYQVIKSKKSQISINMEIEELVEFLLKHLNTKEVEIVMELIIPSYDTQQMAWKRLGEARRERDGGKLRMNVRNVKILQSDIAEKCYVSPATVSRVIAKVREIF